MFDRITLAADLVDCRGGLIARKGLVVSAETIADAAKRAAQGPRRLLSDTFIAQDLHLPLADPPYRHLFRGAAVQGTVARALLSARLPSTLYDEVLALKQSDAARYRHALCTAAVAVRMLVAAVGEARALPEMAAAALLHDLGMRHLPPRVAKSTDPLDGPEAELVAAHPLLGAYHLATVLGPHPAVQAALSHHWQSGNGYPRLSSPPPRSVEVVAIASTFSALTQPRPFRSDAYDARGAADLLIGEASAGRADESTVRLLVHALRGGSGDARHVRFGRSREGHTPAVNRHTAIAAPERSPV